MRVIQKVKTVSTHALLSDFAWGIIFHPPYSLDLAPSDLHLFKQFLDGRHIGSDEEVKKNVKDWFNGLAADFCDAGMQKLVT
jgi:histone-lysine N-methyltransferase SETMAR